MDHPISSRGRLARGILVLVLGGGPLLGPSIARAQDKADDFADEKRCERRFTVLSPMPASCLEPIETDRPDKTDTVATVPAGHAQVEVGIAEYEIERVAGASDNNLTIGNNIYKLGIADKLGPIKAGTSRCSTPWARTGFARADSRPLRT